MKTDEQLEQIATDILASPSMGELVLAIVERAHNLYVQAGAGDDFGLQHVGPSMIVFGGTNRVYWSAATGFVPDKLYCTERFLHNWYAIPCEF